MLVRTEPQVEMQILQPQYSILSRSFTFVSHLLNVFGFCGT